MKNYLCYIKSHAEWPDYEREIEAKNKKEAVAIIMRDLGKYDWDERQVAKYIVEIDKNGYPRNEKNKLS